MKNNYLKTVKLYKNRKIIIRNKKFKNKYKNLSKFLKTQNIWNKI